jgi:glutamine amidotransferase
MMEVSVLDYGAGNVGSVIRMLEKSGAKAFKIATEDQVLNAQKLIIPGVGSFDYGMQNLLDKSLIEPLNTLKERNIPILGICLGMQLMCKSSEEGKLDGLGWLDADVVKFDAAAHPNIRIPHMGWNTIDTARENSLLGNPNEELRFYFVHSYYVSSHKKEDVMAYTTYGNNFVSAFSKDNVYGVQFHPEKSHRFGMNLIQNYLKL